MANSGTMRFHGTFEFLSCDAARGLQASCAVSNSVHIEKLHILSSYDVVCYTIVSHNHYRD